MEAGEPGDEGCPIVIDSDSDEAKTEDAVGEIHYHEPGLPFTELDLIVDITTAPGMQLLKSKLQGLLSDVDRWNGFERDASCTLHECDRDVYQGICLPCNPNFNTPLTGFSPEWRVFFKAFAIALRDITCNRKFCFGGNGYVETYDHGTNKGQIFMRVESIQLEEWHGIKQTKILYLQVDVGEQIIRVTVHSPENPRDGKIIEWFKGV